MIKKFGFTLAEVLITLTIIGVVAALAIPVVVAKYEKMQTVTKLKKEYSILYNAYRLSVDDNGKAENWNFSLSALEFYKKYLSPYLKDEICMTSTGRCKSYSEAQCPACDYNYTYTPQFLLNDGSCMSFYYDNGLRIILDLNCSKGPNRFGRDIYNLGVNNAKNRRESFGFFCQWCGGAGVISQTKRSDWQNTCKASYTPSCGGLIQYDGWQIKDDYPW